MGQRIVNILEMENDLCFQFEIYRRESGPSPWAELIKIFRESLSWQKEKIAKQKV